MDDADNQVCNDNSFEITVMIIRRVISVNETDNEDNDNRNDCHMARRVKQRW